MASDFRQPQVIPESFKEGQIVEGRVVSLAAFGPFLEFEDDVTGLLLVTESLAGSGQLPADFLTLGDQISVRILSIDNSRTRMSVSQRAIAKNA